MLGSVQYAEFLKATQRPLPAKWNSGSGLDALSKAINRAGYAVNGVSK